MKKKLVITIDGPAASGKSTVSRMLSKELGIPWLSTGVFYRGAAFVAHAQQVELSDSQSIVQVLKDVDWKVILSTESTQFWFNGEDVSQKLQAEHVGSMASQVSQLPDLRQELLEAQRGSVTESGLIAEGRDCGTVVFPEADLKIYLTADPTQRVARRAVDEGVAVEEIADQQRKRDLADSSRSTSPLMAASDALTIDTSETSADQVVAKIVTHLASL